MSFTTQKPPSWGLFCFLSIFFFFWQWRYEGFYRTMYVSPELFLLLLAAGCCGYFLLRKEGSNLAIEPGAGGKLLIACAVLASLLALNEPAIAALIILYLSLYLLLPSLIPRNAILFSIALAGLIFALLGVADVVRIHLELPANISALYPGRLVAPFGQPNLLGCMLVTSIAAYLQMLKDQKVRLLKPVYLLPVSVMCWALFLTASRAALLALIVAACLSLYVAWKHGELRSDARCLVILVTACAIAYLVMTSGFAVNYVPPGGVVKQASESAEGTTFLEYRNREMVEGKLDFAAYSRFNYWMTGILMALDHPIVGVGPGEYKKYVSDYTIRAAETLKLTYDSFQTTYWAHNDFFQLFAELGLPLAVLAFLGLGLVVIKQLKSGTENLFIIMGVVAFCVAMCFGHPFRHHLTFMPFLLFLGLLRSDNNSKNNSLVPQKVAMVLAPFVLVSGVLIAQQAWRNAELNDALSDLRASRPLTGATLEQFYADSFDEAFKNNIYAWEFQHRLLVNLYKDAMSTSDNGLAEVLASKLSAYRRQNSFYTLDFAEAQLRYKLRDYELARQLSFDAFQKKPDRDEFFDIYHLVNVLQISLQEKRPVIELVGGDKVFTMLKNVGYLKDDQLDDSGIARPGRSVVQQSY